MTLVLGVSSLSSEWCDGEVARELSGWPLWREGSDSRRGEKSEVMGNRSVLLANRCVRPGTTAKDFGVSQHSEEPHSRS